MKKFISFLLILSILFCAMSICGQATANVYTKTVGVLVEEDNTFNPDNFAVSLSINPNKIATFDGESNNYTYYFENIRVDSTYYDENNPDAFYEIFSSKDFTGVTIYMDLFVEFESEGVFGELEYTVSVSGFSAPIDVGIDIGGLLGDSAGDVSANLPTTLVSTGTIEDFPSIDFSTIKVTEKPQKFSYYDSEKFDATGTKLEFSLTNNKSGVFTYNEKNSHVFSFAPSNSEQLSIYDTEVATMLFGHIINYTPITVNHKWPADNNNDGKPDYVNITTYKYTEQNPGYHAIVCEGCGETHDAQPHVVRNSGWEYNYDQTFVSNGTMSNTCIECGTILIADVPGTADFNTVFADMHFIKVIFEYINVLLRFIGAATY